MTDGVVVVDSGQVLETTESAIIAKEEADRAEQWAKYAENQANLASDSAIDAASSRDAAAQSAQFAEDTVNGFDAHAAEKQSDFDANATEKTNTFNQNAAQKQDQIDASVNAAAQSENNAEIWAEGTDEEVQKLGGVHSSKGWVDEAARGQIQADWNQTDDTQKDFIKNKPDVVHKTGNETIAGIKTFSQGDIRGRTSTSSSSGVARYACFDKGGIQFTDAWITRSESGNSNGIAWAGFRVSNSEGSVTGGRSLAIMKLADSDTIKTEAPTPPAGDNSTQIATTAWVKQNSPNFCMPKKTKITLTPPSANVSQQYTSPANGYFVLTVYGGSNEEFFCWNLTRAIGYHLYCAGAGGEFTNRMFTPAAKGDVVDIKRRGVRAELWFIELEGE